MLLSRARVAEESNHSSATPLVLRQLLYRPSWRTPPITWRGGTRTGILLINCQALDPSSHSPFRCARRIAWRQSSEVDSNHRTRRMKPLLCPLSYPTNAFNQEASSCHSLCRVGVQLLFSPCPCVPPALRPCSTDCARKESNLHGPVGPPALSRRCVCRFRHERVLRWPRQDSNLHSGGSEPPASSVGLLGRCQATIHSPFALPHAA